MSYFQADPLPAIVDHMPTNNAPPRKELELRVRQLFDQTAVRWLETGTSDESQQTVDCWCVSLKTNSNG